jgi:hypothetical protein
LEFIHKTPLKNFFLNPTPANSLDREVQYDIRSIFGISGLDKNADET